MFLEEYRKFKKMFLALRRQTLASSKVVPGHQSLVSEKRKKVVEGNKLKYPEPSGLEVRGLEL